MSLKYLSRSTIPEKYIFDLYKIQNFKALNSMLDLLLKQSFLHIKHQKLTSN